MTGTTKTIPDVLVETRGNQRVAAEIIGCNRMTVNRYARDKEGKYHVIYNGVLMTKTKMKGNQAGTR